LNVFNFSVIRSFLLCEIIQEKSSTFLLFMIGV